MYSRYSFLKRFRFLEKKVKIMTINEKVFKPSFRYKFESGHSARSRLTRAVAKTYGSSERSLTYDHAFHGHLLLRYRSILDKQTKVSTWQSLKNCIANVENRVSKNKERQVSNLSIHLSGNRYGHSWSFQRCFQDFRKDLPSSCNRSLVILKISL